jgi:hypothetical protein
MPIESTRIGKATFFPAYIFTSIQDSHFAKLLLWLHVSERIVVSTAIAGREPGAVLLGRPAGNGGMLRLAACGREFSQVQPVAEGSITLQWCFGACV